MNLDDAIAEPSPECYRDPFPRPYPNVKFIMEDGKCVGSYEVNSFTGKPEKVIRLRKKHDC